MFTPPSQRGTIKVPGVGGGGGNWAGADDDPETGRSMSGPTVAVVVTLPSPGTASRRYDFIGEFTTDVGGARGFACSKPPLGSPIVAIDMNTGTTVGASCEGRELFLYIKRIGVCEVWGGFFFFFGRSWAWRDKDSLM